MDGCAMINREGGRGREGEKRGGKRVDGGRFESAPNEAGDLYPWPERTKSSSTENSALFCVRSVLLLICDITSQLQVLVCALVAWR